MNWLPASDVEDGPKTTDVQERSAPLEMDRIVFLGLARCVGKTEGFQAGGARCGTGR